MELISYVARRVALIIPTLRRQSGHVRADHADSW
jgi:hypothetical protein